MLSKTQFNKVRSSAPQLFRLFLPEGSIPTEEEFTGAAQKVLMMLKCGVPITDDEFDQIASEIHKNVRDQMMGEESYLKVEHEPWLDDAAKENIAWKHWERYRDYLIREKFWNDRLINALDHASDKILDLMGDPRSDKPFERRGLIMGSVQSGKTANYTAVCNKAADAGYNVIIVLTGMLEDLRRQTQSRLDVEFASKDVAKFTTIDSDFDRAWVASNNLSLLDVNTTALFVIKKNKSRLESLIAWLDNSRDAHQGHIKQSLLLIDDEADNASINTNDPDENPTAINGCIRRILKLFRQTTYIGITATPFANIFIRPDSEDEMLGDDLFPRDFIYALDVPDSYIGPDKIFGDESGKMLVAIKPAADEIEPDVDKYFPKRHKADLNIDELPDSLYDAMNYFLLVNAIRDLRGEVHSHRTMLIHVSRFTNVQRKVHRHVARWLEQVKKNVCAYAQLDADEAERNSPMIAALHKIFDRFELGALSGLAWEVLLRDCLYRAIEPIIVGLRNSSGEHPFDYRGKPEGLRVIAIGGNSFSRGLTLEGLCVTYFYRNSRMYDTLMQMGRWFGFRKGYDDLCRLWTTREIMSWYGFINDALKELNGDIRMMQALGKTPKDFGLRVRRSPTVLTITAPNKMRSGRTIRQPISLSRQYLETPRLIRDKNILENNRKLLCAFIDEINRTATFDVEKLFWRGVDKNLVANLVNDFKVNPWYFQFQGSAISKYIREMPGDNIWDVLIVTGVGDMYSDLPIDYSFKMIVRNIVINSDEILIGKRKVHIGTGEKSRFGLTDEQIAAVRDNFYARSGKLRGSFVPDREYMIEGRNPILFVYAIDVKPEQRVADIPDVLFAIGIGLPDTGEEVRTVDYVINAVEHDKMINELDEESVEE